MGLENYNDELYHYGVKGMKWGVRNDDKESGTSRKQKSLDKYYQQYKDAGYSDKDAKQAAEGKLAARNALIIAGTVAATAATAYAIYRYKDYAQDKLLSADHVLQTVHTGQASTRLAPGNPFYATYGKADNTIYSSKLFAHFTDQSNITKFMAKDGIKVASEKSGKKVFDDLLKNDKEFKDLVMWSRPGSLTSGKDGYRAFNAGLVLNSTTADKSINKKFYDALRANGYGAVLDMNDKHLEGWTFNPMIVFDNSAKRIVSSTPASASDLGSKKQLKATGLSAAKSLLERPYESPAVVGLGAAYCTSAGLYIADEATLKIAVKTNKQPAKTKPPKKN